MSNEVRAANAITSPLEGEVGEQSEPGGRCLSFAAGAQGTPLSSPPPQGMREQTERAEGKPKTQFRRAKRDIVDGQNRSVEVESCHAAGLAVLGR